MSRQLATYECKSPVAILLARQDDTTQKQNFTILKLRRFGNGWCWLLRDQFNNYNAVYQVQIGQSVMFMAYWISPTQYGVKGYNNGKATNYLEGANWSDIWTDLDRKANSDFNL